jgi:hypothetical protein
MEDHRKAIFEHERTLNLDSEAYRPANRVFMRRHFCRLDPWPAVLNRRGFGEDVYIGQDCAQTQKSLRYKLWTAVQSQAHEDSKEIRG